MKVSILLAIALGISPMVSSDPPPLNCTWCLICAPAGCPSGYKTVVLNSTVVCGYCEQLVDCWIAKKTKWTCNPVDGASTFGWKVSYEKFGRTCDTDGCYGGV